MTSLTGQPILWRCRRGMAAGAVACALALLPEAAFAAASLEELLQQHAAQAGQTLTLEGPTVVPAATSATRVSQTFRVRLAHADGTRPDDGTEVTVTASGCALTTEDANPALPGVQVKLSGGQATLGIVPPRRLGSGVLWAMVGDLVARLQIHFGAAGDAGVGAPAGATSVQVGGLPAPAPVGQSVAPAAVTIERPAEGSETFLKHLTISGSAPDKSRLRLQINGRLVGIGLAGLGEAGKYAFVNVEVEPGPQVIEVIAALADGTEAGATRTMHVQGPPVSLVIDGPETVPADARSNAEYTVRLLDAWERTPPEGDFITLDVEGTSLDVADADPNTPGVQVRPKDGAATFQLRAPRWAGPGVIKAATAGLQVVHRIQFTTPNQPFVLVGHAANALGKLNSAGAGAPSGVRTGLFNDSRVGFFARGTLGDRYLVTSAFDSKRSLQDRLFKELDPDRLQPVFGDTSSVFYEAQSQDQFFLQVERDGDFYRYGDFNSNVGLNHLSAYQRTLTGIRLQHQTPGGPVVFFGARTAQTVERAELRGNGTSGYYFLPRAPVVQGSEKVTLEVRDRNRPNLVLQVDNRLRYLDYDIDYEQGSLFFKQAVPGIDEDQNPVFIVVVYESDALDVKRNLFGARSDLQFGELSVGTTLVHEDRGAEDYRLFGVDAALELPRNTLVAAEFARSDETQHGSAWGLEAQSEPLPDLSLRAYVRETDLTFDNPSSPLYEVGTRRLGLAANYQLGPRRSAALEYYDQSGNGAAMTTTTTRYLRETTRTKVKYELLDQSYSGPGAGANANSTLLAADMLYRLREGLELYLAREQNFGGENTLRPDGTTVGADYQLTPTLKLRAREKLTDEGQSIASLGFESRLLKSTSLTSTYEINSVNNGGYNQASVGLNTALPVAKDLTGNLAYEKVQGLGGGTSYNSTSVGLEYKPAKPFTSGMKFERRSSGEGAQTSFTLSATGEIIDDLGVMVRHTKFNEGGAFGALLGAVGAPRARTSLGLAYRPANDHWNVLARYHIRDDSLGLGLVPGGTAVTSQSTLGSVESLYQPKADTQVALKYAWRRAQAASEGVATATKTDLWLVRASHDLNSRWTFSADYRVMRQHETGTKTYGYGLELARVIRDNLMLGVGYNFAGEDDADFSDGRRWAKGFYLRLGFKFDEDLFGLTRSAAAPGGGP